MDSGDDFFFTLIRSKEVTSGQDTDTVLDYIWDLRLKVYRGQHTLTDYNDIPDKELVMEKKDKTENTNSLFVTRIDDVFLHLRSRAKTTEDEWYADKRIVIEMIRLR